MDAKDIQPGIYPVMYSSESSTGHGRSQRHDPVHGIAIVQGEAPFLKVKIFNLAMMLEYDKAYPVHVTHDSSLRVDSWGERLDLNTWT